MSYREAKLFIAAYENVEIKYLTQAETHLWWLAKGVIRDIEGEGRA